MQNLTIVKKAPDEKRPELFAFVLTYRDSLPTPCFKKILSAAQRPDHGSPIQQRLQIPLKHPVFCPPCIRIIHILRLNKAKSAICVEAFSRFACCKDVQPYSPFMCRPRKMQYISYHNFSNALPLHRRANCKRVRNQNLLRCTLQTPCAAVIARIAAAVENHASIEFSLFCKRVEFPFCKDGADKVIRWINAFFPPQIFVMDIVFVNILYYAPIKILNRCKIFCTGFLKMQCCSLHFNCVFSVCNESPAKASLQKSNRKGRKTCSVSNCFLCMCKPSTFAQRQKADASPPLFRQAAALFKCTKAPVCLQSRKGNLLFLCLRLRFHLGGTVRAAGSLYRYLRQAVRTCFHSRGRRFLLFMYGSFGQRVHPLDQ